MRVVIVDDEAPARERLADQLAEMSDCRVVGEASTGSEALDLVQDREPDVVLMDIRMPGMDGVEAARHIAALDQPPAVIFTTAYDAYAIEAFEAQAVGYLLKPIRRERLAEALGKAARLTRPQLTALASREGPPRRSHIGARAGEDLHLIPVSDIRCFVAESKYVKVHHSAGTDLIDDSLKALAEEFEAEFARIHRSALVSLDHLEALERDGDGRIHARVRGMHDALPVSRRHAAALKKRLQAR